MRSSWVRPVRMFRLQPGSEKSFNWAQTDADCRPNGKSKLSGDKLTARRILLLNLGMESTQEVKQALSGQGCEITADGSLTVDEILALSPELLITEATP